jgi:type VI secretion system secreted protein VgrG
VDKNVHDKIAQKYFNDTGMEFHLKSGMKIVLDAGMEITLKAGSNFIKIDPSGVSIQGTLIKLNSGGSAGSVETAQTNTPEQPQEADNAGPGEQFRAPSPPAIWESVALDFPTLMAQGRTLTEAAQNGTPFCATCGK